MSLRLVKSSADDRWASSLFLLISEWNPGHVSLLCLSSSSLEMSIIPPTLCFSTKHLNICSVYGLLLSLLSDKILCLLSSCVYSGHFYWLAMLSARVCGTAQRSTMDSSAIGPRKLSCLPRGLLGYVPAEDSFTLETLWRASGDLKFPPMATTGSLCRDPEVWIHYLGKYQGKLFFVQLSNILPERAICVLIMDVPHKMLLGFLGVALGNTSHYLSFLLANSLSSSPRHLM